MATNPQKTLATLGKAGPQTGGSDPLLGKNRASPPSHPQNREFVRVATASRLMASHWKNTGENLKGSSVLGCGRWRNYGADPNIAEIEIPHGAPPRMLGHFACRSAWSCDHCARARVSQTRSWLRGALIPAMDKAGLSGALLTFTIAHAYGDDWAEVVERLYKAFSLFDRRMAKWYRKVGCVGKLKALEAPVGANGLHPHLHVLMTYQVGADLVEIEAAMRAAWSKAVAEVGGRVNEHGFDFKADCVNDYAAKLETSHELASHGTKKARGKGRLLGQLLDRAAVGDKTAGAEWLRAQGALGGRMRFHAGGLPKKLGIPCPSEWEDEAREAELDAERAERPEPARISYPQVHHLKATGTTGRAGLAVILRAARTADPEKVLRVVAALCAEVDRQDTRAGVVQRFADWTDDHFQAIVDAAGLRRLSVQEVPAYIEAKARGFALGMGEAHGSEAKQTGVSRLQNQDAGRDISMPNPIYARLDRQDVGSAFALGLGQRLAVSVPIFPVENHLATRRAKLGRDGFDDDIAHGDIAGVSREGVGATTRALHSEAPSKMPTARPRQGSPDRVWPHL